MFLLSHDKPCLTSSFCPAPLCSQLCPNTKDTIARAWHPKCCTRSHTEHTWQTWLNSWAPCCHLANVSHRRPWQTQTPQLSMDEFLKGSLYTLRIKHPLKITASAPEPLIVMLWHRLLWALHQLEPTTCGILKLCHIRYITFQINLGKLYLKCAVSCYWPRLERFSPVKDKHGSFSSNTEAFLAALTKLGQRLQIRCCCHIWDSPKRTRPSKELKIFKVLLTVKLEECASEAQWARNPNPNTTPQQRSPSRKQASHSRRQVGRSVVAVTPVRGIRSGHSVPAASQLSGHTVGMQESGKP